MPHFTLLSDSATTLLLLATTFSHYLQWLRVQSFARQRDPFFPDPPVTA